MAWTCVCVCDMGRVCVFYFSVLHLRGRVLFSFTPAWVIIIIIIIFTSLLYTRHAPAYNSRLCELRIDYLIEDG